MIQNINFLEVYNNEENYYLDKSFEYDPNKYYFSNDDNSATRKFAPVQGLLILYLVVERQLVLIPGIHI